MNELSREEKTAAARVRLTELAARFLERTRGDITTLRAGLARLAAGEASAVGDIRQLAHRMVGTGATLGFASLSERAATLERLAESCAPGVLPDEACRARLAEALEALEAEILSLRRS